MTTRRHGVIFAKEGKWTPGADATLVMGDWQAWVDGEGHWKVRGPDPDDAAHYAGGDIELTAAEYEEAGNSEARRKIRRQRAKEAARSYIRSMTARPRASGHATRLSAQARPRNTGHAARSTAPARRSVPPKKSPAQLNREIAQVLGGRWGQAASPDVGDARRKARAARVTAYRILLTPDELRAVEFARGRYAWPDMLSAHAAEDGAVAFTESEMWQWADDVDSDAEGGHSSFPLASPSLAEKLQDFYDSRV